MICILYFESKTPHASFVCFNNILALDLGNLGRILEKAIIPDRLGIGASAAPAVRNAIDRLTA
jgi:hypothetical protein